MALNCVDDHPERSEDPVGLKAVFVDDSERGHYDAFPGEGKAFASA